MSGMFLFDDHWMGWAPGLDVLNGPFVLLSWDLTGVQAFGQMLIQDIFNARGQGDG